MRRPFAHQTLAPAFVALGLLGMGGALRAEECVTKSDLTQGIAVAFVHDVVEVFTTDPLNPSVIFRRGEFQGEVFGTTRLGQGYVYLSAETPEGATVRYDYGLLPGDMPRPRAGATWEVVATVTSAEGLTSTERQFHRFGPEGLRQIGMCTYRYIAVTTEAADYREEMIWFSDLGFALRKGDEIAQILPFARLP